MLVFGVVAAGILVVFVFLAVALGARASRQAKTIQARVGEHVTARSPSVFQHECSFLTKASAESVYDYFMDFPCHADWEQGVEKIIEWQGRSFTGRCDAPAPRSRAARLKRNLSSLQRRTWTVTASDRPASVDWEVRWEGEDGLVGPIIERLTLATESFGTRVTLSEDSSGLIPAFAKRLTKFEDAEFQQRMADGLGDNQLKVARSLERADRFRRAMEASVASQ